MLFLFNPIIELMKSHMQNSTGIMSNLSESNEAGRILFLIEAVGTIFDNNFDKGWFLNLLDKMSFPSSVLREIRQMAMLRTLYEQDFPVLEAGVMGLEEFIAFARRYIQPVIRDELGVSGFTHTTHDSGDPGTDVIKGFFVYAFPYNLDRLEDYTKQLKPLVQRLCNRQSAPSAYVSVQRQTAT